MTVPDVLGLYFRLPGVAVVKVLLGRDSRSVCALVPDRRVNDRGFHEVTLVDMGDTAGPDVSVADLSLLRLQWPVSIVNSRGYNRSLNNCGRNPSNAIGTLGRPAARF